ncbi:MAG: hypothetical protein QW540_11000 [Archaeoglobaceae archaeon]
MSDDAKLVLIAIGCLLIAGVIYVVYIAGFFKLISHLKRQKQIQS